VCGGTKALTTKQKDGEKEGAAMAHYALIFKSLSAMLKALLKDYAKAEKRRIARFKRQWERDPITHLYVR
jgi:hypothetical protein